MYNTTPTKIDIVKSYPKLLFINRDEEQATILQGKILVDAWNANKEIIDRNGDNIMQYIMLKGKAGSLPTTIRTKSSVSSINNAGILTEQIAEITANWSKELAKNSIDALFPLYSNTVEVI